MNDCNVYSEHLADVRYEIFHVFLYHPNTPHNLHPTSNLRLHPIHITNLHPIHTPPQQPSSLSNPRPPQPSSFYNPRPPQPSSFPLSHPIMQIDIGYIPLPPEGNTLHQFHSKVHRHHTHMHRPNSQNSLRESPQILLDDLVS